VWKKKKWIAFCDRIIRFQKSFYASFCYATSVVALPSNASQLCKSWVTAFAGKCRKFRPKAIQTRLLAFTMVCFCCFLLSDFLSVCKINRWRLVSVLLPFFLLWKYACVCVCAFQLRANGILFCSFILLAANFWFKGGTKTKMKSVRPLTQWGDAVT